MVKQSVINTFNRVGINFHEGLLTTPKTVKVYNRFGGGSVVTTAFIAELIHWVYNTSNAFGRGDFSIKVADFDRIRYFVLAQDREAYNTCLD